MVSRDSSLDEIKNFVKFCMNELYSKDPYLFERNGRKGVCERCLVFRFAHYMQNSIQDYHVDCDFNSSFKEDHDSKGNITWKEKSGKPIENEDGTKTGRFIDIIVHKRDSNPQNNFICFEIKKWNNYNKKQIEKDKNNLRRLTSSRGYLLGFYLSLHRNKEKTKWTIYCNGAPIIEDTFVFQNENSN
jgi:hypothetical protein